MERRESSTISSNFLYGKVVDALARKERFFQSATLEACVSDSGQERYLRERQEYVKFGSTGWILRFYSVEVGICSLYLCASM